jgi:hypothetical protein
MGRPFHFGSRIYAGTDKNNNNNKKIVCGGIFSVPDDLTDVLNFYL